MSWLFIDSSTRDELRLAWLPAAGRIRSRVIRRTRVNVPVAVASFADLKELASAKGICVVSGPGSFSAIRGGVLVANLLARLTGKPLVGVTVDDAVDLSVLRTRLASGALPAVSYVAPVYDAEPNITC